MIFEVIGSSSRLLCISDSSDRGEDTAKFLFEWPLAGNSLDAGRIGIYLRAPSDSTTTSSSLSFSLSMSNPIRFFASKRRKVTGGKLSSIEDRADCCFDQISFDADIQ